MIWAGWVHAAGCAHDLGRVGEYRAAAVLLQAHIAQPRTPTPAKAPRPAPMTGPNTILASDKWLEQHR